MSLSPRQPTGVADFTLFHVGNVRFGEGGEDKIGSERTYREPAVVCSRPYIAGVER